MRIRKLLGFKSYLMLIIISVKELRAVFFFFFIGNDSFENVERVWIGCGALVGIESR